MKEAVDILTYWLRTETMSISQLKELGFNAEDIIQASQNIATSSLSQFTTVNQVQTPLLPLDQVESLLSSCEVLPSSPLSAKESEILNFADSRSSTNESNDDVSLLTYSWERVEALFLSSSQEDISTLESTRSSDSNKSSNSNLTPSSSWEVVEASEEEGTKQPLTFLQKLYDKQDNDFTQNEVDEVAEKLVPKKPLVI